MFLLHLKIQHRLLYNNNNKIILIITIIICILSTYLYIHKGKKWVQHKLSKEKQHYIKQHILEIRHHNVSFKEKKRNIIIYKSAVLSGDAQKQNSKQK